MMGIRQANQGMPAYVPRQILIGSFERLTFDTLNVSIAIALENLDLNLLTHLWRGRKTATACNFEAGASIVRTGLPLAPTF